MKCNVCNYEYEWDWEDGQRVVKKGNKGEFIEISMEAHNFIINSGDSWEPYKETQIYACPNCGSIRLDDFDLKMLIERRK